VFVPEAIVVPASDHTNPSTAASVDSATGQAGTPDSTITEATPLPAVEAAALLGNDQCPLPGIVPAQLVDLPPPEFPSGVEPRSCEACEYPMYPDWLDCPRCRWRHEPLGSD
jgi:hypothetical protein